MKFIHLSFLFSFIILSCAGMEPKEVLAKFPDIPEGEVIIYLEYATEARKHLAEITGMIGRNFVNDAIPHIRKHKYDRRVARYCAERNSLAGKCFLSMAAAGGFGYCANKGCTIPETTAAAGVMSICSVMLALNFAYHWYNLAVPTYESVAQEVQEKHGSCDWREVIARKIIKQYLRSSKGSK